MRRYLRYYCEAFRLQGLSPDEILARVRVEGDGPVREVIDGGGSVIAFLGHMGNWDLAGAWGTTSLGPVTTVVERLEPEEVFEEFLAFRESLGMTIIPLTGGVNPFPALREAARRPGIIPLLADRDLTSRGVEVDFCGWPARMAPGPAALALAERRPLHPVSIRHEPRGERLGHRHHVPPRRVAAPSRHDAGARHRHDPGVRERARSGGPRAHGRLAHAPAGLPRGPRP